MSEHTPGPWQLGPKMHDNVFTVVNPTGDAETGDWLVAKVRWEQDARLIAAAPELRAAGALALNQLSYALQRASFQEDNVAITAIGIAMRKLRAALAKADGKP